MIETAIVGRSGILAIHPRAARSIAGEACSGERVTVICVTRVNRSNVETVMKYSSCSSMGEVLRNNGELGLEVAGLGSEI